MGKSSCFQAEGGLYGFMQARVSGTIILPERQAYAFNRRRQAYASTNREL